MRNVFIIIFVVIYASVLYAQTPGKRESQYGFEVYFHPPIYYDFFVEFPDEDNNSRIDFNLNIQNDLFRFSNVDNQFEAQYEITVAIKQAGNETAVFSETWRNTILVKTFGETNSKNIYQTEHKYFDVNLAPGNYQLFLDLTDSGTGKGYRNSRSFNINEDKKYTDIKLGQPGYAGSHERILGSESPLVEFNKDQRIFFTFKTPEKDSLIVTSKLLRLYDEKSPIIRQKIYRLLPSNNSIDIEEMLERRNLKEGKYLIKYRIKYNQEVTNVEKYFTVVWFDKPAYLYKHDLALRPMVYMLSPEEFDEADALSYDELGEWMENFWDERDPTPESPLNEIKYEYFSRVEQANKKFSQRFTEGWETDRGKAFILYGEPSRIESNRYAINKKPYEIWFYDSLKRKLTFVDKHKEDNYLLVSVEDIEEGDNE